jgi:hypothetical protein
MPRDFLFSAKLLWITQLFKGPQFLVKDPFQMQVSLTRSITHNFCPRISVLFKQSKVSTKKNSGNNRSCWMLNMRHRRGIGTMTWWSKYPNDQSAMQHSLFRAWLCFLNSIDNRMDCCCFQYSTTVSFEYYLDTYYSLPQCYCRLAKKKNPPNWALYMVQTWFRPELDLHWTGPLLNVRFRAVGWSTSSLCSGSTEICPNQTWTRHQQL